MHNKIKLDYISGYALVYFFFPVAYENVAMKDVIVLKDYDL